MSTLDKAKKRGLSLEKPLDMATPIITLHELGVLIASRQTLAPGHYEMVVQYKFGPGRLSDAEGQFSAMAISFGGMGLRLVDKHSPMTIEVKARAKKAAAAPVKRAAARKIPRPS